MIVLNIVSDNVSLSTRTLDSDYVHGGDSEDVPESP